MLAKLFFAVFVITAGAAAEFENGAETLPIGCCQCTTSQFYTCQNSNATSSSAVMRIVEEMNNESMNKTIDRMQKMSRIVTAIALQKDLYSGDVDTEELVSELFRIGTVSDVKQKFDYHWAETLKLIRDLPGKLIKRDGLEEVQEKLKLLEEIRYRVEKTGDFENWSDKEAFISEITAIKDDGIDLELVNTVYKHVKALPVELDLIKSISLTDNSSTEDIAVAGAYMRNLKETMENLLISIDSLAASDGKPWSYKAIESATDALRPIFSVIDAIDKAKEHSAKILENNASGENDYFRIILKNLINITETSKSLSSTEIEKLAELIVSDKSADKWLGFPNGWSDIELVFEDLEDSWVKQVMKSDKLISSLDSLKELMPKFRKTGDVLAEVRNDTKQQVDEFMDYVKKIREVHSYESDFQSNLEKLWECKDQLKSLPELKKSDRNADFWLDQAMRELNDNVQEFLHILNTTEVRASLNWMISDSIASNDVDSLMAARSQLLYVHNLTATLLRAEKAFAKIEIPKEKAQRMLNAVPLIGEQVISFVDFQPLLQCFRSISQEDLVERGLEILDKFKDPPGDLEPGYVVMEKLSSLISDLEDITNSLLWIKYTADQETLKEMPKIYEDSHDFVKATNVIVRMKRTIDVEDEAQLIIDNSELIRSHLDLLDQYDKTELEQVLNSSSSILKMFEDLKNWKARFSRLDSDTPPINLSAYSDIFLSAKSVKGLLILWYPTLCVDKLASKVDSPDSKNRLISVRTVLEKMREIDVWFLYLSDIEYFDKVADHSLLSIDNFFAEFDKKDMEIMISKGALDPPSTTTTLAPEDHTLLYAGIAVGVVGFLIFIGVMVCCVVGGKKKKTETDVESDKTLSAREQIRRMRKEALQKKSVKKKPPTERELADKFHDDLISRIESIRAFNDQNHVSQCQSFFQHLLMMIDSETKTGSMRLVKKYSRETRALLPLHASTRFKLSDFGDRFLNDYIHASVVSFQNGFQMILTQGPQKTGAKKLSTIEKFWWMARGSEFVVMLGDLVEKGTGAVNCDAYFPSDKGEVLEFRGLTLTCTEWNIGSGVISRKILVSFEGEAPFSIEHRQYYDWPEDSNPFDAYGVIHMLKEVRISKKPVIVHCSNGVGRSGALAFMELGLQTLSSTGSLLLGESLYRLRAMRALAVQTPLQLAFCTVVIHDFDQPHSDSRLHRTYQGIWHEHNQLMYKYPVKAGDSAVEFYEQPSSSEISDESDTEFGKPIVKKKARKMWF